MNLTCNKNWYPVDSGPYVFHLRCGDYRIYPTLEYRLKVRKQLTNDFAADITLHVAGGSFTNATELAQEHFNNERERLSRD
jgi:hypothetical protein